MNKQGVILVVDDDALVLEALYEIFIDDYEIVLASSGKEAIEQLRKLTVCNAIILDIRMAKLDGLQTASELQRISPDIPIIFHTGYPGDYSENDIEKKYQPFDYVGKNESPVRLQRAVRNAVAFHHLHTGKTALIEMARNHHGLVGHSAPMQEVYKTIEKIGPTDSKVMILGPTGTGKELVARAIHSRSARENKQLAIFNCNHKSADLVGSELFGHLKGSFTGAIADRIGMFEYADKGTLFLDEIGDLDSATQAKILRVIETGEMQKIGSPEIIKVDVRLICATHQNLKELVDRGEFREDLYFRLKGVTIHMPALKSRREDIGDLIDYSIEKCCSTDGGGLKVFEPEARELLIAYDWPGNVRQLIDTVNSLIYLTPSYYITAKAVEKYLQFESSLDNHGRSLSEQLRNFKRTVLLQTLDRTDNNVSAAARELHVDASNLRKLIKDLNIELPSQHE